MSVPRALCMAGWASFTMGHSCHENHGQLRHKGNYFLDLSNHCRINPPNIFHPFVKNYVRHVFYSGLGDSGRHFMIIYLIRK